MGANNIGSPPAAWQRERVASQIRVDTVVCSEPETKKKKSGPPHHLVRGKRCRICRKP